ncbi:MAG: [protein-PII] uridylyltransferase [Luminiphilus sp.]
MKPSPSNRSSSVNIPQLTHFINETSTTAQATRAFLKSAKETLAEAFEPNQPVTPLLQEASRVVDAVLVHLWTEHVAELPDIALIAVGGYGRGELFPQSDIDILILSREALPDDAIHGVERFIASLWDTGLQIGHSVRTLKECEALAREDLTVVTTMMESRHLLGNVTLELQLKAITDTDRMWPPEEFIRGKLREQEGRHDKYSNTEYALEPNIKSSPGGLRDLQVIEWITLRCFKQSLTSAEGPDFLSRIELDQLNQGKEFLSRVRFALHSMTGRAEDRLLFDHQKQLAALWQMVDGDKLAVEQFMQVYYRWMKTLSQLNELLIEVFEHRVSEVSDEVDSDLRLIDDDFEVADGRIRARNDAVFTKDPSNLLRIFVLIGNDPLVDRIEPNTQRLIRRDAHLIDDAFRASEVNRDLFMQILGVPHNMTKQLRRMSRHGVMGRYLPAFGAIIGQMQFDLFHAYTVDAHTMEVIANTRRFMRADYTDRFPVSTRIARRLRDPKLLYIAALFHDIGKGRGGDHSELGAVDAEAFCRDHKLSPSDTALIIWLVKNHLLMSHIAQRRDISDPEEIQRFAEIVGTQERLDYLYTLTVADIAGTNPELWNAWRSSLMRQLYTETRRALSRGLQNPIAREEVIRATKRAAAEALEYRGFLEDELADLWNSRGNDYFVRERAEDIAWHTEAIADHDLANGALVLVRQAGESPIGNATQIFVHARDEANTFAKICAALDTLDLSVHDARIYSDDDGSTLDTFYVLQSDGSSLYPHPDTFSEIRQTIQHNLLQPTAKTVTRHMPRTVRAFTIPTQIHFSTDRLSGLTTLEISTADRPGLLARIGSVLSRHGVTVQGAKIQTLGERVEDIFFLSDDNGRSLEDQSLIARLEGELLEEMTSGQQREAVVEIAV